MEEIEVKILEIDKKAMVRKLLKMGAKKTFEGTIVSDSYDYPDGRIGKADSLVRLRKQGARTYLTFKRKIINPKAKVRDEQEVEVEDFDTMKNILSGIGLVRKNGITKTRESYLLGYVKYEIDEIKGIPVFMEVEAPTFKKLEGAVHKLGFEMDRTSSMGTGELLAKYKKTHV